MSMFPHPDPGLVRGFALVFLLGVAMAVPTSLGALRSIIANAEPRPTADDKVAAEEPVVLAELPAWSGSTVDPIPRLLAERPLFAPDRRPPPPRQPPSTVFPAVAATPEPPRPAQPDFVLVGLATGRQEGAVIVLDRRTGRHMVLSLGGEIDGWTLVEAGNRSARLVLSDGQELLLVQPAPAELLSLSPRGRIQ